MNVVVLVAVCCERVMLRVAHVHPRCCLCVSSHSRLWGRAFARWGLLVYHNVQGVRVCCGTQTPARANTRDTLAVGDILYTSHYTLVYALYAEYYAVPSGVYICILRHTYYHHHTNITSILYTVYMYMKGYKNKIECFTFVPAWHTFHADSVLCVERRRRPPPRTVRITIFMRDP